MLKRLTMLSAGLFLMTGVALAQSTVSGTVVDNNGDPVVGAAVRVDGTKTGTVTDVNGHFSIAAPANSKLTVSYLGMKEQTVKAGQNIKVTLSDDQHNLDEVMVVAYGKQKKSSFTGSAAEIKADKLADRQVANLTQALSGEVAGVQVTVPSGKPGETASVRIRGIGSFSSSNAPLYVVDGVPYDGDISAINPNDIASLTVLKDAAANALYGARGANGVILVTTKSGNTGEAQVTFDAKIGHESRAVSNYDVIKSPATYMEKAYEAIYNSGLGQGLTAEQANKYANKILPTSGNGGVGYTIFTVLMARASLAWTARSILKQLLVTRTANYTYLPDNWYDEVYNKSNVRQEYNATVSGKGEKINYFTSAGYLNDEGVVKNSGFERFTTRSKVDYQVKPWLKLTSNVAYTHYNSNYSVTDKDDWNSTSSANIFYVANFMAPYLSALCARCQGQYHEGCQRLHHV
jgi:TonB-linked SusC/RagA family outer membrane protein